MDNEKTESTLFDFWVKKTYIFVLDFEDGKCFKYNYNKEDNGNITTFLKEAGHNLLLIEYMITDNEEIIQ